MESQSFMQFSLRIFTKNTDLLLVFLPEFQDNFIRENEIGLSSFQQPSFEAGVQNTSLTCQKTNLIMPALNFMIKR